MMSFFTHGLYHEVLERVRSTGFAGIISATDGPLLIIKNIRGQRIMHWVVLKKEIMLNVEDISLTWAK